MKCLVSLSSDYFFCGVVWGEEIHFFFGLFAWTGRLHSCSQADVSSTHHNHVNLPRFITTTKSLESCQTLCDPIDGSTPGSSVPGTLQARTLEWVAISFPNACMHAKSLQLCMTLCDPTDSSPQALLSTGFSRQEYWSGLPFPSPHLGLVIC